MKNKQKETCTKQPAVSEMLQKKQAGFPSLIICNALLWY
jgi:hypothetical protein